MKVYLKPFFAILAALWFWGCAGDPLKGARAELQKGDRIAALAELKRAKERHPDSRELHYALFVLQRYLAVQGDPRQSELYLQGALEEYRWIVKADALNADFIDMEGSLKSKDISRSAYEAAYALVYPR